MAEIGKTKEGRVIVLNEDGTISTERTITVQDPRINNGLPTNIPTLFKGRLVPQDIAVEIIARTGGVDPDTGKKLQGHKNIQAAVKAAQQRSKELGKMLRPIIEKLNAKRTPTRP